MSNIKIALIILAIAFISIGIARLLGFSENTGLFGASIACSYFAAIYKS